MNASSSMGEYVEQPEERLDDPDAPRPSDPAPATDDQPVVPGRRRGRTAALITTAAVLGLVAGTCAGYLVQAEREPTKLPPLSQPELKQAEGKGPAPLSASQDRRVRTDGDLRKLLLKKPRGARQDKHLTGDRGWMTLASYAAAHERPGGPFADLVQEEFRRAAVTGWWIGGTQGVEIRLVQYRQEERAYAGEATENNVYWREFETDQKSFPVPGSDPGMAYVSTVPRKDPGSFPRYTASAFAWRGDIAMEIFTWDTKPVPKSRILDLAERQLERL